MNNQEIGIVLARIETKLDDALDKVKEHDKKLASHDRWHWIQVGLTAGSHGLEHAGAALKAVLAFIHLI